ncbi:hypothetical protein D1867_05505 [Acidianus infernus]|uniref:Uncharacterized protein n=1 Tax=Acidianus infernus TaxID=12915 RepID=A0A6A9QLA6_ACIIN|nr:hypothetical protein [Acidianus infernus]MUM64708.1 hypothetical protein [Acidianus infernus]
MSQRFKLIKSFNIESFENINEKNFTELENLSIKILLFNYLTFISSLIYLRLSIQLITIALLASMLSLIYLLVKRKVNFTQNINLLSLTAVAPLLLPMPIEVRISTSLAIFSMLNWNFNKEDIYHQFLKKKREKILEMKRKLLQGSKTYRVTIKRLNKLEKKFYGLYQKLQVFYIVLYFLPLLTLPFIKYETIAYEEGILTILILSSIISLLLRNSLFDFKNILYISLISVLIWFI